LLAVLGGSENEAHDRCLLLLIFRHGLRVSEACGLKISQVDIEREDSHCQYLAAARSVGLT
jgi:type 1 fimbriae regulatory protein FimB